MSTIDSLETAESPSRGKSKVSFSGEAPWRRAPRTVKRQAADPPGPAAKPSPNGWRRLNAACGQCMHRGLGVSPNWLWGLGLLLARCRCEHCRGWTLRFVGPASWLVHGVWFLLNGLVAAVGWVGNLIYNCGEHMDAWLRARFGRWR